MSFLGIFGAIEPVINKVLAFIPDPKQKLEAQQQLMNGLMQWDKMQTDVNKVEAGHRSLFVAGWRPFIGWVCGLAMAYQFILAPMMTWGFAVAQITVPELPKLDEHLWQLTVGLLGMGGLRTIEKSLGVSK